MDCLVGSNLHIKILKAKKTKQNPVPCLFSINSLLTWYLYVSLVECIVLLYMQKDVLEKSSETCQIGIS